MSTLGERKCALLLVSLRKCDRRRLLAALPPVSAKTIRDLIDQLEAAPWPAGELVDDLLADEVRGLTAQTSLALDQLVELSRQLPPAWFARVLSVWAGVDRSFCLALLDDDASLEVRSELGRLSALPPKLADAIKAEAAVLCHRKVAA